MPRCPDIYQLQAFVDCQTCQAATAQVAAHVAACAPCAQAVRELRLACLPLQALAEQPPADLMRRVNAAVRDVKPLPALTCEQALEGISLRLDGALNHEQMQRLEAHVCACSPCCRAALEMETAAELLRTTAPQAAPAGLLERVQAAAELAAGGATQPEAVRRGASGRLRRWGMSLAGMAAAAAVFLTVIFNSLPNASDAPAPVAVAPSIESPARSTGAVAPRDLALATHAERSERTRAGETPGRTEAARREMPTAWASRGAARTPEASRRDATTRVPTPALPAVRPMVRAPAPVTRPSAVALPRPEPMAVAIAGPALPEVAARGPELDLSPTPRTAIALLPRPAVTAPAPSRATGDDPKPTPAAEPAARRAPVSTPARSRSNWVTRPAVDEREIYHSDDRTTRLADARNALARDVRDIRRARRSPGYVIH